MPTAPSVIDIDPDPPTGFEALLAAGLQQDKTIPEWILRRMPAETLSVSDLVATDLPRGLEDKLCSPESCLSKQTPVWTVEHLWNTDVPSRTWLNDLDIALDRGWHSGIHSIEAPVGSNGQRFPLWTVCFWLKMVEVIKQKEKWKKARGWMRTMVRGPEIQEAEKLLDRTPWGLKLWPLIGHQRETRVGYLAELLSNEWLGERHIDTLVTYLGDRLRKSCRSGAAFIADHYLASLLSRRRNENAAKLRGDQELGIYAEKILDGRHDRLLFPAHFGGKKSGHWVVFSVDIRRQTTSYGEFSCKRMTGCPLTRRHTKVTRLGPRSDRDKT